MSRNTITTTTTSNRSGMYLSVRKSSTGKPIEVAIQSTHFGNSHPVDVGALVIFSMLSRHISVNKAAANTDDSLHWDQGAFRKTGMNYDVWTEILGWLLDSTRLFFSKTPFIKIPADNQERLERFAFPIRRLESRIPLQSLLFAQNYQKRYEISCLLDAVLNADHDAVKKIFEGKNTESIKAMLSVQGSAVIAHLGIERSGTPLQMALYSYDEKLFELLAHYMDPENILLQCQKVFNNSGVRNFDDLIGKQNREAIELCTELKEAFRNTSPTEIINALTHVAGTTSALQRALNNFNTNLNQYVKTNSMHNPCILQQLLDIYNKLTQIGDIACSLLSQQAFGPAQKSSSARWLQYCAQGIYYLCKPKNPEDTLASFSLRRTNPAVDIRSSNVFSRLGVDSCIDVFGARNSAAGYAATMWPMYPNYYRTYVNQKQYAFKTVMQACVSKSGRQCVIS